MITITLIALGIFTLLALVYFIYEGIVAPSLRAVSRLQLFALRDRLRKLKMEHRSELSDEVFRDLQSSINFATAHVSQIDLRLIRNASKAFEHDAELREHVARRIAIFDACPIEELHLIREEYFEVLDWVLFVNSAGLIVYIIPIFLVFELKESVQNTVKKVFSLPDNEIDKITPQDPTFAPA
jgi:hypothetical protein